MGGFGRVFLTWAQFAVSPRPRLSVPRWRLREAGGYGTLYDQVARFPELPGPPIVVIQDLDQPPKSATFGEIMAATYKSLVHRRS